MRLMKLYPNVIFLFDIMAFHFQVNIAAWRLLNQPKSGIGHTPTMKVSTLIYSLHCFSSITMISCGSPRTWLWSVRYFYVYISKIKVKSIINSFLFMLNRLNSSLSLLDSDKCLGHLVLPIAGNDLLQLDTKLLPNNQFWLGRMIQKYVN